VRHARDAPPLHYNVAMPRYVDSLPGGAEGWREVWRDDLRYRSKSALSRLFERGGRLLRKAIGPDLDRQKDFNLASLDLLDDVRTAADQVRADLRGDVERLDADLRSAIVRDVTAVRELVTIAVRRNDALIEALDQKIETLAVRVRDLTNPLVHRTDGGATQSAAIDPADFLYRRLEDRLRGSETTVAELLRPYAEMAREHAPLVDVGCGRGELLELCHAAGIAARGFDTNERSVADLRVRGLKADLAAIPGCFSGLEDESVGSVAAIHVVEHLPLDAFTALFRESFRVLKAGGLLMIETPNAESIAMASTDFWRDPSHLAPRHPAALTVLGREHGFALEELRAIHPFPDSKRFVASVDDPVSLRNLVEALNDRLYGGQDLRVVFRK
jgi:2-polyprenyl-3-methyl-5-hydroxy-6-metoxy-1,4-benzoquinol methylase